MAKVKSDTLHVKGIDVGIYTEDYRNEYISLTDIARFRNSDDPRFAIQNWMRNRNTIEFLGLWESLHNPNFNRVQFDTFRTEAGLNRFVMTPSKWVENTGSIGITAKAGRYGGTYAHSDIAMEFASWISAEFKLYLMKDYRRLKFDENSRLSLSWNLNREISKLNYRVHTDAIQQNLLPPDLTREQQSFVYADEADMLNVALFGLTAAQWRSQNQGCKGNIRDYASLQQLLVLANMESYNALLIEQKLPQTERLQMLRQMAVRQLQVLSSLDVTNLPSLPPDIGND
ncbi:MAG: KilA-N domain-containing protein [Paraprevotella sp.]|nr:KilA-N domain-containing protein [Paraprevotella sp.]